MAGFVFGWDVESPPERNRIWPLALAVGLCVVCFVVPRVGYAVRLELMELRYAGWFLLLIGVFIWALMKLGPRDR